MSVMVKMDDNGNIILRGTGLDGEESGFKIESSKSPYVQKLIEERDRLKDQNLDLYFGRTPNYESEVLMSKIEVLEEDVSELKKKLEREREEKERYKDMYNRIYDIINEE